MGETIPPESKSQLASERARDPHESVTIAPPAPNFEELLRQPTPVPSLSQRSDQHFRAAIDASTRAGSSLSELSKMVAELSSGVVGAKQANEQLTLELATLRALLGATTEQQLGANRRLAELEQEVLATRAEAERERRFLTEQHDRFLAALLEEHEEALAARDRAGTVNADASDLTQRLAQAESLRAQAEAECERVGRALANANAQLDEAQARAEKRERERDELRAEASQLRARLGTHRATSSIPPAPVSAPRPPPSYRPPPALQLDAGELDSTLHARPWQRLASVVPRLGPPPAELERALPVVSSTRATSASSFPRVSTRPGVGGPGPSEPPPSSFGPAPTGWTPPPPAPVETPVVTMPARTVSAASLPAGLPSQQPALKKKPDPTTRPLISYSLGGDGVKSETLEGARLSSKPPQK
jgi:hypothetical protein